MFHCHFRSGSLQPVQDKLDWLQSFLFYIFFSLSLHYFFIMILFNPTSSYLWLNKNFLSSKGIEVNKNSTSYTSVVSPHKKKKKKEKKKKERVWGQTKDKSLLRFLAVGYVGIQDSCLHHFVNQLCTACLFFFFFP